MIYKETRTIEVFAQPFSLNKGMVSAFCALVEMYQREKRPIQKKELGLPNAQYTNFATMKYFGIIAMRDKGSGWWPTEKGLRFYRGEIGLTMPVYHMDNVLLPDDHPAYSPPYCKKRETKYIYHIDETRYKQIEEWQAEMRSVPSLF